MTDSGHSKMCPSSSSSSWSRRMGTLVFFLYYSSCQYATTAFSVRPSALATASKARTTSSRSFPSTLELQNSSSSSSSSSSSTTNDNHDQNHADGDASAEMTSSSPLSLSSSSRRGFFQQTTTTLLAAALGTTSSSIAVPTLPAHAGALLQFPVGPNTQLLKNSYHFMRAGTSELEVNGIYSTNPLFLTNRENAMAEDIGESLVLQALEKIKRDTPELFPTIAYHSLAANGMDTGDLIARQLKLGREKLLPEFTYLDQRGVGLWDSGDESLVKPAVWALDYLEAGKFGEGGRPPANEDGTPNETLGDQFIRLRQFISLQESRTSGETILVIFPDGTGPALLSCMIAGIPYKDVHALEYEPGEIRLDISPESVRALFEQRKDDPTYLAILEDGKEKLATLRRQQKSGKRFVGLKEQMAEKERLELDAAFDAKKQADSIKEQERQEMIAQEKRALAQAQREAQELRMQAQNEAKAAQEKRRLEEKEKRQREREAAVMAKKEREQKKNGGAAAISSASQVVSVTTKTKNDSQVASGGSSSMMATVGLGVLGLGIAALGGMAAGGDGDADVPVVVDSGKNDPNDKEAAATVVSSKKENKTDGDDDQKKDLSPSVSATANVNKEAAGVTTTPVLASSSATAPAPKTGSSSTSTETKVPSLYSNPVPVIRSTSATSEPTTSPAVANQNAGDANNANSNSGNDAKTALPNNNDTIMDDDDRIDESLASSDAVIEGQLEQLASAEQAMKDALQEASSNMPLDNGSGDDYFGDDDDDWLRVLVEIRDEVYEDDDDEDTLDDWDLVVNGDGTAKSPGSSNSKSADL